MDEIHKSAFKQLYERKAQKSSMSPQDYFILHTAIVSALKQKQIFIDHHIEQESKSENYSERIGVSLHNWILCSLFVNHVGARPRAMYELEVGNCVRDQIPCKITDRTRSRLSMTSDGYIQLFANDKVGLKRHPTVAHLGRVLSGYMHIYLTKYRGLVTDSRFVFDKRLLSEQKSKPLGNYYASLLHNWYTELKKDDILLALWDRDYSVRHMFINALGVYLEFDILSMTNVGYMVRHKLETMEKYYTTWSGAYIQKQISQSTACTNVVLNVIQQEKLDLTKYMKEIQTRFDELTVSKFDRPVLQQDHKHNTPGSITVQGLDISYVPNLCFGSCTQYSEHCTAFVYPKVCFVATYRGQTGSWHIEYTGNSNTMSSVRSTAHLIKTYLDNNDIKRTLPLRFALCTYHRDVKLVHFTDQVVNTDARFIRNEIYRVLWQKNTVQNRYEWVNPHKKPPNKIICLECGKIATTSDNNGTVSITCKHCNTIYKNYHIGVLKESRSQEEKKEKEVKEQNQYPSKTHYFIGIDASQCGISVAKIVNNILDVTAFFFAGKTRTSSTKTKKLQNALFTEIHITHKYIESQTSGLKNQSSMVQQLKSHLERIIDKDKTIIFHIGLEQNLRENQSYTRRQYTTTKTYTNVDHISFNNRIWHMLNALAETRGNMVVTQINLFGARKLWYKFEHDTRFDTWSPKDKIRWYWEHIHRLPTDIIEPERYDRVPQGKACQSAYITHPETDIIDATICAHAVHKLWYYRQ